MFHVEQRLLTTFAALQQYGTCDNARPFGAPPVISLERYADLLGRPALRAAIGASILGRLPIGITGLAVLMLIQDASQSFGRGGAVAACYVAGLASVAPVLGRVIDRVGPRSVLRFSAIAFPASLAALVAAQGGEAQWPSFLFAALAGACFPPITVCMRTFLKQQLKDDALLAAAYSLESVLIETIFIVGPGLVAVFVALASPAAAVIFAAACGCAGALLFQRSKALEHWRIEPRGNAGVFGPLAERGFPSLLAVITCYACAFGLVEIGTTAYATEAASPAMAGVLLGVMSVGSAVGGLVYGSRTWRLPLARQFALMLAVMGIGIAPLALLRDFLPFALWCVAAGIAMAPALIMQSMLVARLSRPEHSTEAFTWSSTGLLAGVGLGLTFGGAMLETARSPSVFATAAGLSLLASGLALRLVRARERRD